MKTSDYLPILSSAIITDIFFMLLLLQGIIHSKQLELWYKKYNLGAVIADVLIIVIGLLIAKFVYPYIFSEYALWKFILLAVGVQIIHDILFYLFIKSFPPGKSGIIDVFKAYGKEVGANAILADSAMIITTCLLFSAFKKLSLNANINILIGSVYILPYVLYSI